MGQAFDKDGAILGEMYGDTKREVFDKLIERHPDAHAIHIQHTAAQAMDAEKRQAVEAFTAGATTTPRETLEQFFRYDHLPERLQRVSQPFANLAAQIIKTLPRNPERTVALRKLLEAKDCAVRALLFEG